MPFQESRRPAFLLVRPFVWLPRLLRPLLTSRAAFPRRPFRRQARSPQVRTRSFTAQPPDLRNLALTTKASHRCACSPCSVAPRIRFLFIGSRLHSMLPSHARSPLRSCTSFRSLWSACGRTFTSKTAPMLGAHILPGMNVGDSYGAQAWHPAAPESLRRVPAAGGMAAPLTSQANRACPALRTWIAPTTSAFSS